ncbi:MAG: dTDP-4-dehydrorhamnose reductase [Methylophilaceae bacterium]
MPDIKSILVTGGSGQLGQSLQRLVDKYPEYSFTFPTRQQLDLSCQQSMAGFFKQRSFDLIINCAAHTAVDKAESEPELADQLNHLAVKQLAEMASKQNAKLIHLSTDYVFAGNSCRPYVETDEVSPQGVYGVSKLKGEQAVQKIMPTNAVIIRTSWVYGEFGNNFVKTMLKLGRQRDTLNVIFDQVGTPTYAGDLAEAMMSIVQNNSFNQPAFETGIYHFSNEGVCSWYDFATTIFELSGVECNVKPIETKDYPTPAKRPHYSVLNKAKIKHAHGLDIPYWKEALQRCLRAIQENAS